MSKKSWIMIAFLANLALLPLVLATPGSATAVGPKSFFFHCCSETPSGTDYCCYSCCIFTWDCLRHAHCGIRLSSP